MRNLPEDNLAYPILVKIGNSQGTGFFLNTDKESYFVTAKHVLFDMQTNNAHGNKVELIAYPKDHTEPFKYKFELDLNTINSQGEVYTSSTNDVAGIKISTIKKVDPKTGGKIPEFIKGVTITEAGQSGFVGASSANIKFFQDVLISNDTFIFGYPSSIGLKKSPQINYEKPLLKKGIIAGKNETLKTIILDCAVFPGNSGGPVIEIETIGNNQKISIIGVVSQFVPYVNQINTKIFNQVIPIPNIANSGYSVVESMDEVFKMLGL